MHQDGLMPILDLAVKMQENYVTYQYYRKSMANFKVLMAESAMPTKMKRICLTQEVVRILRNTSKNLEEKIRTYYLSEFSLRMKDSGYTARFRLEVLKSGMATYERQLERDQAGI